MNDEQVPGGPFRSEPTGWEDPPGGGFEGSRRTQETRCHLPRRCWRDPWGGKDGWGVRGISTAPGEGAKHLPEEGLHGASLAPVAAQRAASTGGSSGEIARARATGGLERARIIFGTR